MKKFVARQTESRWKKLAEELRRAAKTPEDAEAIHDLRVSIRRFVQCLRSFADFFDKQEVKRVRRPLRKLMRRCGAVRNCDISIELLQGLGFGDDAAVASLREKRAKNEAELVNTLKRWRRRKLEWKESPGEPEGGPWQADQSPAENAKLVLPAMLAELVAAGNAAAAPRASFEAIHRFRIQGKRFRYTVELFETFLGADGADALQALKGLQDRLGELNDCVTALALLQGHEKAKAAVNQLRTQRKKAFHEYWAAPKLEQWTFISFDMEKPSPAVKASKKPRARSRRKASAT